MSAVLERKDLPVVIGAAFGGGFLMGSILVDRNPHAIIVSPKALGTRTDTRWHKNLKRVAGATSYFDSYANTKAMAEAGSPIAKWALEQRIGGFDDWCIGARDANEVIYRAAKPTATPNACWFRDGENPSSIPPSYPYTENSPAQTQLEAFREGGAEAIDPVWLWSSTQCEGYDDYAWAQLFSFGSQNTFHKGDEFAVRLVRTIAI